MKAQEQTHLQQSEQFIRRKILCCSQWVPVQSHSLTHAQSQLLFTVGSCEVTLPYTRTATAVVHSGFLYSDTPLHTHNHSFLSCTMLERLALLAVTLPTLSCLICSKSLHLQMETPGSSALTKLLWCRPTPLSHSSRGL